MKNAIVMTSILALSACGGSDGSSESTSESSPTGTQNTTQTPTIDPTIDTPPQQPSNSEETVAQEPPEAEETTTVPPSEPAACELSAIDQSMLDAVNAVRAQTRLCRGKSMPSVPPVAWNCTLAGVAVGHSTDMATNNFFSHTGSNGLSMVDRIENANYEYRNIGENIAAGQATVDSVMTSWLNSDDGHCENIMSANYTELGAGRLIDDNSLYRIYWTQNFGRPR